MDDIKKLVEALRGIISHSRAIRQTVGSAAEALERLSAENAELRARLEQAEADLRAKEKEEYRIFQELKQLSDVAERLPILLRKAERERDAARADLERTQAEMKRLREVERLAQGLKAETLALNQYRERMAGIPTDQIKGWHDEYERLLNNIRTAEAKLLEALGEAETHG